MDGTSKEVGFVYKCRPFRDQWLELATHAVVRGLVVLVSFVPDIILLILYVCVFRSLAGLSMRRRPQISAKSPGEVFSL